MTLADIDLTTIEGSTVAFGAYADGPVLVVNVASKCGHTPQYAGLQALYEEFGDRGLTVLGFPCNQFAFQEPGSEARIQEFCTTNYGVSFPLFAKVDVNGRHAHPLYRELVAAPDETGIAGPVKWNFEKFLVHPTGRIERFRSKVEPDSSELRDAVIAALTSSEA